MRCSKNDIERRPGSLKKLQPVIAALVTAAIAGGAGAEVVAFRDAAKIRSWDAWDDHKAAPVITNILQKERKCVTWEKLNGLDWGLKEIGRFRTRTSAEIKASTWSVGCETLDRDYAVWDNYKALLPLTGVKRARFFSGWAKTEQERNVYDFTWLDPALRECAAMGIRPWVCISYGNPVWGSDFRLGMRVKQLTENPEAMEAWLRYVKALVTRYRDIVDEWEIWNEPFGQGAEYAELFIRTARAVRELQPGAKLYCAAMSYQDDRAKNDYYPFLEKLRAGNALDLASLFLYHPYYPNPDRCYGLAGKIRRLVKEYSPAFDIMQGEAGCPAQLEFDHAMHSIEWTEYSQAKWDLRHAIRDASNNIPSSSFTFIDLQYTFMLQSYGFLRSNALKEFVYRRPKFYAMSNVYSLFDCDTHWVSSTSETLAEIERRADPRDDARRTVFITVFERFGKEFRLYWYDNERPTNRLEFDRVTLRPTDGPETCDWKGCPREPVLMDMITGRVFELSEDHFERAGDRIVLRDIPMWDSPILIGDRSTLLPAEN